MRKFSLVLNKWPSIFCWVIFFISTSLAQDYRRTENFDMKTPDGPTTRSDGSTYDGELSQDEYMRRREEYLRKFRNEHSSSEYKKEKFRLQAQQVEGQLNKDMQKARERDQEWQNQKQVNIDSKTNPVVVKSLQEAFDLSLNEKNAQQGSPQVSREQMMKELQGLQDKIKSGNVNMKDVFKALNRASGQENKAVVVPSEYRGHMAEEVFKTLHQVRSIPSDVLTKQLRQRLEGHPLEETLTSHDQILPKTIAVIQDPNALPDAALILSDREKLFLYAIINLCLLILGIFLKRKIRNSDTSWKRRFVLHMTRWFGLSIISFSLFIFFFGKNLSSLWRVLTN